ncbi:MAG: RtcB family protein, partial [Planctomycetaceae bacterium]|nr:RtcB family protein [Planctomycetaceae bacterium]
MNRKQLAKIGIGEDHVELALAGIQSAAAAGMKGKTAQKLLKEIAANPTTHHADPHFGGLAQALCRPAEESKPKEPVAYRTWGAEYIDEQSHRQMEEACSLPHAVAGALMPDAHLGYGLPIGGVLALEGAVCPYAVGVDIACRMKLSVLDVPMTALNDDRYVRDFESALENGTVFGAGKSWSRRKQHEVMDRDWAVSRVTRENKDKAWAQLGTSGSGNHFVEFGQLTLHEPEMGLPAGEYVALLSHSGSRGTGHSVCSTYSAIAQKSLPRRYRDLGRLAWLELDSDAGQEYWAAMNL